MLKILGALLIICGTGAWGIGSALKMKNRVAYVKAFAESMDMLKDEVCINLTPLPKVMEFLATSASYPADELYKGVCASLDKISDIGFWGVWMEAVKNSDSFILGEAERDVFIRLGAGLGKYDTDSQMRVIETAKRSLERIGAKAETERAANSKLHAYLGIAAGMLAVVVLF